MTNAYMVICDFGILPGYLTLLLYLIILILLHFFVIKPLVNNKNKISLRLAKKLKNSKNKKIAKKIMKYLPITIIAIVFALMFFLYPVITSTYCPHLFWRLFGLDTL
jgi:uncharacterized membrane protein